MRKLLLTMIAITISSVMTSEALAEKPLTIHGSAIPNPASSPQVMSNDAFKETVTKFGAETTNNLNQTVQSQVKGGETGTPASKEAQPASTPQQPQKPPANTDDEDNTDTPQTTQPVSQKPATSSTPQNNQSYSGFGTGQPSQKSGNTDSNQGSKKSSNWNVGY